MYMYTYGTYGHQLNLSLFFYFILLPFFFFFFYSFLFNIFGPSYAFHFCLFSNFIMLVSFSVRRYFDLVFPHFRIEFSFKTFSRDLLYFLRTLSGNEPFATCFKRIHYIYKKKKKNLKCILFFYK